MMKFKNILFQKNELRSRLTLEKIKDYRNVVILQILLISSALLLKDLLVLYGLSDHTSGNVRDTLLILLSGFYVPILWDMLRNFTDNKAIIYPLLVLIAIALGLILVTVNPFFSLFEDDHARQPFLFAIHLILFVTEVIVIYFTSVNIFSGNKLTKEKLWGSACIFLMIGLCFASMYDLITIVKPDSMGVSMKMGLDCYSACIFYSMTIIGGHDAYPNSISLILNLGVIEAVWSNLFIVLLVGRILGKPEE